MSVPGSGSVAVHVPLPRAELPVSAALGGSRGPAVGSRHARHLPARSSYRQKRAESILEETLRRQRRGSSGAHPMVGAMGSGSRSPGSAVQAAHKPPTWELVAARVDPSGTPSQLESRLRRGPAKLLLSVGPPALLRPCLPSPCSFPSCLSCTSLPALACSASAARSSSPTCQQKTCAAGW